MPSDNHQHKWTYGVTHGIALEAGYKQCRVCGIVADPLGNLYQMECCYYRTCSLGRARNEA